MLFILSSVSEGSDHTDESGRLSITLRRIPSTKDDCHKDNGSLSTRLSGLKVKDQTSPLHLVTVFRD